MKKLLLIISLILTVAGIRGATPRRNSLKVDEKAIQSQTKILAPADSGTVLHDEAAREAVRFFGYDKPHNATRESLFISNQLPEDTIRSIRFEIRYTSMSGAELHKREEKRDVQIAPGETTRLIIPTWDATCTFYYYRTPPGRKQSLTPYKVSITPLSITLPTPER